MSKLVKKTVAQLALGIAIIVASIAVWVSSPESPIVTRPGMSFSILAINDWEVFFDGNTTGWARADEIWLVPGNELRGNFSVNPNLANRPLNVSLTPVRGADAPTLDATWDQQSNTWVIAYQGVPSNISVSLEGLTHQMISAPKSGWVTVKIIFNRNSINVAPNFYDTNVIANLGNLQITLTPTT